MTRLLDEAVDTIRALPPEMQDEMARLMLRLAGEEEAIVELTKADMETFGRSLAQAARREFATDAQVRAVWAKHGV